MGASQSAKVDTYEMKMLDSNGTVVSVSHGKGADKSAANNEASAIKSNQEDGAKLSPAKLGEAVQGDQDSEQPA